MIDDVYAAFEPINDEIKQIVTDWQMRPVGGELTVNDHADHRYDQAVIGRLRHTDAKVGASLAPLTAALPRFALYPERLGRALALVDEGSTVVVPRKSTVNRYDPGVSVVGSETTALPLVTVPYRTLPPATFAILTLPATALDPTGDVTVTVTVPPAP